MWIINIIIFIMRSSLSLSKNPQHHYRSVFSRPQMSYFVHDLKIFSSLSQREETKKDSHLTKWPKMTENDRKCLIDNKIAADWLTNQCSSNFHGPQRTNSTSTDKFLVQTKISRTALIVMTVIQTLMFRWSVVNVLIIWLFLKRHHQINMFSTLN